MSTNLTNAQKEKIHDAYEDVRSDSTSTTWLVCKYEDKTIVLNGTGDNYDELLEQFGDEDRAFAFVRVIVGDELSKRAKFVLINWTGIGVSAFNKAKMGPDKQEVKKVLLSFAVEISSDNRSELSLSKVEEVLRKAGGANYGTGVRD